MPTHASKSPRPWGRALAWLLFLGPFFFASYGFATWVTSQRTDVGVMVFDWERHIPFLPWTIVPYWLIDGLYAISLFLCATRIQLDTHAKRLLTAQGVAVACFLLFPLRFSFERPPVEGIFGVFFDVLGQFDKPFNQAPSLHIALMVLLWVVYLRALPKPWHGLVHGTFALIGVSVLTTWQHHFIDVPTGLALGGLCLWLWPDDGPPPLAGARLTSDPSRRRLAGYYALGSLACVFLAGLGDAALWLCWPAGALALVACAYLALGPAAFQKRPDGTLTPAAFGLLAPYLLGRLAQFTGLDPQPAARRRDRAGPVAGAPARRRRSGSTGCCRHRRCQCRVALPKGGTTLFQRAHAGPRGPLVGPDRRRPARHPHRRVEGPVLVCCALGFSRSALAVAAWLLAEGRAPTPEAAEAMIRQAKPAIVLGPAQRAALAAWWDKARQPAGAP